MFIRPRFRVHLGVNTRRLMVSVAALALGACRHNAPTDGIACTEIAVPALSVSLSDSVTGATAGFTNVAVVATDGAYRDSVFQATYPASPFNGPISLAYEHRGTLTVTVRASGYSVWTRNNVVVTGDVCHVTTVALTARLARP